MSRRRSVDVDGQQASVSVNAPCTPQLLLLDGMFWSRVCAPVLPTLGESVVAAALDFPGCGHGAPVLPALRDHGPPTLLIWGAEDGYQPLSYAERFAREVPWAELAVVAGAGHIPMEDDPARVAEALLAFLELITITEEAG